MPWDELRRILEIPSVPVAPRFARRATGAIAAFVNTNSPPRRVASHPFDTNKKTPQGQRALALYKVLSTKTMGAGGSIPADEAAAKEAGKTDDEIAIYKFCVGL